MDPVQRRQIGIAALVASAVFGSVATAAGITTAARRAVVTSEIEASDAQCEANLKQLGATMVTRSPENVTAKWSSLEGGYTLLGSASAGAMACPGWTMSSFCMGQECQAPGVTLELIRTRPE